MPRHDHNGVSFESPEDWVDRTIVAHVAPASPEAQSAANVVMTTEPLRQGETLRTHADRQLMELAKQLQDFDIVESREATLGGQPAIFMRFLWRNHLGGVEQTMTMTERATPKGRGVLTFTTTSRAVDAHKDRPVINQILRSVRLGPATAPAVVQAPPPSSMTPSAAPLPTDGFVPIPGYRRDRR